MNKCRICLRNKNNLRNIFQSVNNTCYADMMQAISKVKIAKDTGIATKLCRSCRLKLEEAYKLKLEIERSDLALNELSRCKRLYFDNFTEIKCQIEIESDCKQSIKKFKDVTEDFVGGIDEIIFCNTLIKKVPSPNASDICLKPVPVLEFLRTMKDDDGDDFINDGDDDFIDNDDNSLETDVDSEDADYIPPQKLLKQTKINKSFKTTKSKNDKENKNSHQLVETVCIKPVNLKGLRLVYDCKYKHKSNEQQNRKYKLNKPEMCPHCGVMVTSLRSHILRHTGERKFPCDECSRAYYSTGALTSHKKSAHATTKDFKCDQCIAAFPNHLALKSHQIMHSSESKFVCEICSKQFKRRGTHKRHILMHSSANKSFMCELCNMSFFTPYMLRHHMRVHTGERPFLCQICSQSYSYKHDFNRHCLNKHGVFLKRRAVKLMNEETLMREKQLIRDLALRLQGDSKDDQTRNPFEHEGPGAAMAFHLVMKAIAAKQIPIDFQL